MCDTCPTHGADDDDRPTRSDLTTEDVQLFAADQGRRHDVWDCYRADCWTCKTFHQRGKDDLDERIARSEAS